MKSQKFGKVLKDQDLFGHQLELNFNQDGSKHKTVVGGIFSLILKVFLLMYVFRVFRKLWFFEEDRVFTQLLVDNEIN
jgi:hypothetical protein